MNIYVVFSMLLLCCLLHQAKPQASKQKSDDCKDSKAKTRKDKTKPVHDVDHKKGSNMKKVIRRFEGIRLKAYDAQPNNPDVNDLTIGIGFNLNRPDAKETFKKVLPGVDFDKVKAGELCLTRKQALALFHHDIDNIYVPRAKNKIGEKLYNSLPDNVKTAIVNAVFRGDLGPKTTELIKQEKWGEVGTEYLNHNQYKNAEELGIPGIKKRMDWNKRQFDTMIKKNKK